MTKKTIIINYILLGILFIFNIIACIYYIFGNDTDIVFQDNILKVVEIKVSDDEDVWGYATGFFIDSNGTILTNKHVVYDAITEANFPIILVRLADVDEWLDAEVLKVSESSDLATIKIDKQKTKYFKLTKDVYDGETIYTVGNPSGFGLSFTNGVVSSRLRDVLINDKIIPAIQTSFIINEGNSGGPVFRPDGKLIGIISFRLKDKYGDVIQGASFALPTSTINEFLQND